jgi:alkylation response protein AidB-like acyl-CoA dehydrogenase
LRKLDGEVLMQDDDLVASSAERPFAGVADIQAVMAAKDTGWKDRLWAGVEETGLNVAALPEDLGGTGLGLHDSLGILRIASGAALSAQAAGLDRLCRHAADDLDQQYPEARAARTRQEPASWPGIFDLRARKSRMARQN